ncbi:MAG: trehalose-phosphatase [Dehalococcoidia bacterium]|nr:trehalose-phosphatase [Dehalococcoidia bacterium]
MIKHIKYVFSHLEAMTSKITGAGHILLLSDYDGTLTPIVEKPELASLSHKMISCLYSLSNNPNITLGIISGRKLTDIRKKVNLSNIIYSGNHGLEIQGAGIQFVCPTANHSKQLLHSLYQQLDKRLTTINGARTEDKELSLTLHYRLVPKEELPTLEQTFRQITEPYLTSGKVIVTSSKKAYEIRPVVDWNKGKAITFIAQNLWPEKKPLIIFLGDDVTDNDGFNTTNDNKGISIYVGKNPSDTIAQYFLRSTDEVYRFLSLLHSILN